MIRSSAVLCALAGLVLLASPGAALLRAAEFHVSPSGQDDAPGTEQQPFATLERARDAVRASRSAGTAASPMTVWLHGGVHRRTGPFMLTPEDSGTAQAPVTYRAAPGEQVCIDGGRTITGWRRHDQRLWVADLPEVARGEWCFREVFVNGAKRTRARSPNSGFFVVAALPEGTPKTVEYNTPCQSFGFAPGDIREDWTNLGEVEVVVYHFWTDSHLPIQSVDAARRIVTFRHKAGKVFTDDFTENGARYIVENLFEGLDAPGEWYLDRPAGRLYYYPLGGEDMTRAEVVAPFAPALLELQGSLAERRYVEHVRFEDLGFAHAEYHLPPGNSNDGQGSASVAAAVRLGAARAVEISHCQFRDLGTFAIDVLAGCEDVRLVANEIARVAAGGIRVNGGIETDPPWHRTRRIEITDNSLHDFGQDFPSAVGLLVMNAEEATVAHNDIHDGNYTGVSLGWNWGYGRSVSQQNRVEYNHIYRIGLRGLLSDMGGIYTLGVSPGTVIRHNHIHAVAANQYGGWGIYNDEGSSNLLVESNVVHHTKFAPYNIHYGRELTVRNNIFALGKLEQVSRSRTDLHKSVFFENNIIYWREGELFSTNWNEEPYAFRVYGSVRPPVTETSNFDCDWNLYFNPARKLDDLIWAKLRPAAEPPRDPAPPQPVGWAAWRERGKDRHSLYADPRFKDPEGGDFTLAPDSPAFALGFRPIDLSTVGPRVRPGPR